MAGLTCHAVRGERHILSAAFWDLMQEPLKMTPIVGGDTVERCAFLMMSLGSDS